MTRRSRRARLRHLSLAQKYIGDKNVVAILGPSTSGARPPRQAVLCGRAGPRLAVGDAHVPDQGPPATRSMGTPAFFRVVPGDYVQGPTDAKFMVDKLQVKKVVLLDFQEPYSLGLADAATGPEEGRRHDDPPVGAEHDDRLLVLRDEGPERHGHRLLPDAEAGRRADVRQQLVEQGKKAKVFGGDGSNDPAQFKVPGSYVSNFAARHHRHSPTTRRSSPAGRRTTPARRSARSGRRPTGRSRCSSARSRSPATTGHGVINRTPRRDPHIKKVRIKNWILGGNVPLLDEVQRPAERDVLHLPDPVERLVQARQLDRLSIDACGPADPGRPV